MASSRGPTRRARAGSRQCRIEGPRPRAAARRPCRSLRRRGRMGECGIAAERLGGREGAEAGVVMFSLFEGGGIIAGDGVPPSEPI